jgi:hypothetical protein
MSEKVLAVEGLKECLNSQDLIALSITSSTSFILVLNKLSYSARVVRADLTSQ